MDKSGKPPRRGDRKGMVLELGVSDRALLDKLVERYQKLMGGDATKTGVIRQLIRNAVAQKSIPPLRE